MVGIGAGTFGRIVLAGIAGGAVGGLFVALAVSLANSRFWRIKTWAVTILIAAAAGALLVTDNGLLLFVIWQSAVLASISYGLSPAQGH